MGLGRQKDRQAELLLSWDELPRSQGHPFYDKLQELLRGAGFDRHVEKLCASHYSAKNGKAGPPGSTKRAGRSNRWSNAIGERRKNATNTARSNMIFERN